MSADIAELRRRGRQLHSKKLRRDERGSSNGNGKGNGGHPEYADSQYGKYGSFDLTPRQYAFVMEYVVDPSSGSAAARRAGYSKKSAGQAANTLLKTPNVKSAIDQFRDRLAENTEITMERVINEIAGIAFADIASEPKSADKLKALEMLGRWLGFDVGHHDQVTIRVEFADEVGGYLPDGFGDVIDDAEYEDVSDAELT